MHELIQNIERLLFTILGEKISNLVTDKECEAYSGYDFQVGTVNFKFRMSKVTPKKVGQFVTLWKRNALKETQPFDENDDFDFYIFGSEEYEEKGVFIFPKRVLIDKNILTTISKEGKRGFRLYPSWSKVTNKQAEKSQSWQTKYFINLKSDENKLVETLGTIFNGV